MAQWEKYSDDSMNKVLKLAIISLYGYATYLVIIELFGKFF